MITFPEIPSLPGEEWRSIPGFSRPYYVSSLGRVVGRWKGGCPRLSVLRHSYLNYVAANLVDDAGKCRHFLVHRLVAAAFLGPCPEGYEVHHLDGDKENNVPSNLEYVTHRENIQRARRERPWQTGMTRKLSWEDEEAIRVSTEKRRILAERYGVSIAHIFHIRSGKYRKPIHPNVVRHSIAPHRTWMDAVQVLKGKRSTST